MKEQLRKYPKYEIYVEGIDQQTREWVVHMYEIIETHTATYNRIVMSNSKSNVLTNLNYCCNINYMVSIATITHKNQITIPKEFIQTSNLKGIKKVLLEKRGNEVFLRPLNSRVEKLAGSLAHLAKGKISDLKKVRENTITSVVRQIAKEGL